MSRYIDADKLTAHKLRGFSTGAVYRAGWNDAIDDVIAHALTAEFIEVVRCKDCKHFTYCENDCCLPENFCSHGERADT